MKIALANDHAGLALKIEIAAWLTAQGYEVIDFGTDSSDPADLPDRVRPPGGRGPLGGQQDHHDDPDRGDVDRVQQRQAHQGEQQPHSHHGSCAPPPPDVPGALGVSVV